MAKTFPNVWQNLAWSHIVSPELSMRAIGEWLDMLPMNKISAFGGDYNNGTVIFTYGHLEIARENIARVLGYPRALWANEPQRGMCGNKEVV